MRLNRGGPPQARAQVEGPQVNASPRVSNHAGVTNMKRLDQGHLHPNLEGPVNYSCIKGLKIPPQLQDDQKQTYMIWSSHCLTRPIVSLHKGNMYLFRQFIMYFWTPNRLRSMPSLYKRPPSPVWKGIPFKLGLKLLKFLLIEVQYNTRPMFA